MALRGIQPEEIQIRLKAFFYGNAKVGKTTAAISFPKPYLIDTESGAIHNKYRDILKKNGGAYFETCDYEEIITEIRELMTQKHDYKTLIIDPLTKIYDDLVHKAEDIVGTEFGKHYSYAAKKMKRLFNLIEKLDMNVIITSHAKNEYGDDMKVLGQTFDCYKKSEYVFDLIIEIKKIAKRRVAYVKGSRIDGFEEGESFDFSYEEMERRYGKDILNKNCAPIQFGSVEQISEINHLIDILKIDKLIVDRWLTKAKASTFEEMESEKLQKCIEFVKEKYIQQKAA